jgi:hypothetical protein
MQRAGDDHALGGGVYFIQAGDGGSIRTGYASDDQRRIQKELQPYSRVPLKLLGSCLGEKPTNGACIVCLITSDCMVSSFVPAVTCSCSSSHLRSRRFSGSLCDAEEVEAFVIQEETRFER